MAIKKFYKQSKATEMMSVVNDFLYLCGLPHFWIEPPSFSDRFTKIYDVVSSGLHIAFSIFSLFLIASFFTQDNLNNKQKADRFLVNVSNPLSYFYDLVFLYNRERVKEILYKLMISLKEDHNDQVEEKKLITKFKMYLIAFYGSTVMTLIMFGIFGLYQVLIGLPFITLITAWPDVNDVSTIAETARVLFYIFWSIYFIRICGAYIILLAMLIGLSQQYKNLQSYFYNLNRIFEEELDQGAKDDKYEQAFIRGVQMHSQTVWCVNECKHVCGIIFDAQMLLAIIAFVSLLPVLMSPDRDVGIALANVPTLLLSLVATAYFMWNAGDISFEASCIPEAMYGSGWQNCYKTSTRIRKLLVISMALAKQPVTLKALGVMELSYNSYLGILKTSHSLFSVFY